ncbi:MAG: hypothetical protein ABSB42_09725, partial [Tepidisphaeraceae bacterium]
MRLRLKSRLPRRREGAKLREGRPNLPIFLRATSRLRVLYVQEYQETFYYASSCSRDDERSEESCEHDDRPKTDR